MARMLLADEGELMQQIKAMAAETLAKVVAVVNAAGDGRVILDSEEQVNKLMDELKGKVYQATLQARIDATEASFSPSGRSDGDSADQ